MHINDLIPANELAEAMEAKLVATKESGDGYTLYSYTQQAQFSQTWNTATMNSRGLIADSLTGEIVARPWLKFFNYGQPGAATISLDEMVEVSDKMDGSLIIAFRDRDGNVRTATRGSFTSDQANHASALIASHNINAMPEGVTPLFEAIYPDNRIVLDYGQVDDLFLLGGVVIDTGEVLSPNDPRLSFWTGPRTQVFGNESFAEALKRVPRENAEGIIVRSLNTGAMLKIKQEDYLRLHRAIYGITRQKVWRLLRDSFGTDLSILAELPDEIYPQVSSYANSLVKKAKEFKASVADEVDKAELHLQEKGITDRGEKARYANSLVQDGALSRAGFTYLMTGSDKSLDKAAWLSVEPKDEPTSIPGL